MAAMNTAVLRTVQVGVALMVLSGVIIAIMLVLGVLDIAAATSLAINVGSVLLICVAAALLLTGIFSIGRNRGDGD